MSETTSDSDLAARVFDHFERHLGAPAGSWPDVTGQSGVPLEILAFDDRPKHGIVAYATFGLSRARLRQEANGDVREELLLLAGASFRGVDAADLLANVGTTVADRGIAVRLGELIELEFAVGPKNSHRHLLALEPTWFEPAFSTVETVQPPVAILWLIPLHRSEAAFVDRYGWDRFEDELIRADPDVFDLGRPPITQDP